MQRLSGTGAEVSPRLLGLKEWSVEMEDTDWNEARALKLVLLLHKRA